jgi:alpha-L-fucosidase
MLTCAWLAAVAAITGHPAPPAQSLKGALDPHAGETKAERDKRMHWWREARFGMFIHWGLYAQLAGEWNGKETPGIGEWIMHDLKIPVDVYAGFANQFNPIMFDADRWVQIAKQAGMKYIVMTAKHHEGFAMFHTKVDRYNLWDATPFKRDPIAEMSEACHKAGLKFGVYYSQAQDWHHPGGAAYGGHWDPAQDGDLHAYVRNIAAPQVRELLERYHPAVLWWDTSVDMSPDDIRALTAAFSRDPGLIANNRLGNGVPGDTETPEQYIPATGFPGRDWETCMTINDTWGYKRDDHNFKSSETLIRNLIDIASKGGNYLLNVGPQPDGIIPDPEVSRLEEMGRWLDANGASIYGTTASPYKRLPFDGRATVKGNRLFLNVFSWPSDGLVLPGLKTAVHDARALAGGEHLAVSRSSDGAVHIARPTTLDPVSTAIELRLDGPAVVVEPEVFILPSADYQYRLLARDAALKGGAQLEHGNENGNIGFWTDAADTVEWKVGTPPDYAGSYLAHLVYSCEPNSAGSSFEVFVDGDATGVKGVVPATASWYDYHTLDLTAPIKLSPGRHTIKIVPSSMPHGAVMNLRQLSLTRA